MKPGNVIAGIFLFAGGLLSLYLLSQYQKLKKLCFNLTGHFIKKLTANEAIIELYLQIKNLSDLNVVVDGYDFKVLLNERFITTIQSPPEIKQAVAANAYSSITLVIAFNPMEALKNVLRIDLAKGMLMDKSQVIFEIKGKVSIDGIGSKAVNIKKSLAEMVPNGPKEPC